jgi:hypothetical protein
MEEAVVVVAQGQASFLSLASDCRRPATFSVVSVDEQFSIRLRAYIIASGRELRGVDKLTVHVSGGDYRMSDYEEYSGAGGDPAADAALLWPHYVYVLLDPLSGNTPLYVGKGTGSRVQHHVKEVERLGLQDAEPQTSDLSQWSTKQRRIREIHDRGLKPLEVIVGRFETAEKAFAVEATLIHFVYGFDNLANAQGGHGREFIRTRDEFDAITRSARSQDDIPRKPGIDIELRKNVHTGAFSNAKRERLAAAGAYDFLQDLQSALTEAKFSWSDFDDPAYRRFDPSEANGYLGVVVSIGAVDFGAQFTAAKQIALQVLQTDSSLGEIGRHSLKRLQDQLKVRVGEAKINKYAWIDDRVKYNSIAAVITRLEQFRAVIEAA